MCNSEMHKDFILQILESRVRCFVLMNYGFQPAKAPMNHLRHHARPVIQPASLRILTADSTIVDGTMLDLLTLH